ncbi:hypothetical protein TVAG_361520 [Trichomonas vaginalis G3]|uniref:Nucleoplasmin-like domain-containing protein n=1 Tax=Trichomonas vaginalis (strain ATCC PRA-98 / G3) TaxID=412133 RepID=A2FZR8_TRIV3|nr:nucleoplasmin-like domain family [Trichomonas vaginalis G3]EAX89608.1 hypothetical protein TVAG_361520 [Trichomonas vaginalis G3]KAI5512111.1 nucleoplasmin-like domain family [Trichomonas vaginalis G3]|eukprot:XP_001302538.1 hypothetical protein [Trichomonas vaginalis G3]
MSEDESVEITQSFWGIIVRPHEKQELDIPEDATCIISNVSYGLIDESANPKESTLIAHVKEVSRAVENPSEAEKDVLTYDTPIAKLIPGKIEQTRVSQTFSKFSEVTLENDGDYDIHVSGLFEPDNEEEEEDIPEEDEKEEK